MKNKILNLAARILKRVDPAAPAQIGFDDEVLALAELIERETAAPELLAALKNAIKALALVSDFGTATGENPDMQNCALDNARVALAKAEDNT